MLKKIAITGGIATGKTTLLNLLRSLNFQTLSCDEVVKSLYERGEIQARLLKLFGGEVLDEKGGIDRKRILKLLRERPEFKKALEEVLHPEVLREVLRFFEICQERGERLCFVEVPLLFEVSWEDLFDEVWVITCSKETQLKRLKERGNLEELSPLLKFQIPLEEKEKRGDKVFSSEKSPKELEKELKVLLKEYLKEKGPL
jgi:dephospho-CoA kinase